MTGDGDKAGLLRMLVVAVAAPRADKIPSVFLNKLDDIADFHTHRLSQESMWTQDAREIVRRATRAICCCIRDCTGVARAASRGMPLDDCDTIIVGHGIAGAVLAHTLMERGQRVRVIDAGEPVTSSKIAAGIVTPITGQRLARSWRVDTFWPAAERFFGDAWRRIPHVRLLQNDDERRRWAEKKSDPEFSCFLEFAAAGAAGRSGAFSRAARWLRDAGRVHGPWPHGWHARSKSCIRREHGPPAPSSMCRFLPASTASRYTPARVSSGPGTLFLLRRMAGRGQSVFSVAAVEVAPKVKS